MKPQTLPVIDFCLFATDKHQLAMKIDAACRQTGFFYLKNHGIDSALIEHAFSQATRFFALPLHEKETISIKKSPCFRGYFGPGDEQLDELGGDIKEGIKIGRDLSPSHPLVRIGLPLHGANQWPTGLDNWRQTMEAYFSACQHLAYRLLSTFAIALGEDEEYFVNMVDQPMTTLAPLHYPPKCGAAAAHSDYGCLSLVCQQQVGGLEVYLDNQWTAVPVLPDTLVVNVGDMLQLWTNNTYVSTRHRVRNRSAKNRYSLAFFYDPNFHASLTAIPSCGNDKRISVEISAGEYLLARMNSSFSRTEADNVVFDD